MSSIIKGYEYDVFISYRQNDNKNDGWVTEFVANLKKELESAIKTKINIYTDENPADGLLENQNVDKSLSTKLRSVIFIPVLSQTFCDPDSYAWKNEFLAFNKSIKEDQLDRDIKLRNGNVAGRILPVRIHDLDPDDLKLLQDELGGQLRSIDFVYREPGVNRPLRPDDNEDKNLNKTRYRNQVNKVANSIKEILYSIQNPEKQNISAPDRFLTKVGPASKSIAVLPFVNMSNDTEQEYFSDGISEEIINTLVQIPELKVAGRTSAFSFKNKNEDLRSIGEKLNVSTILEGSVRKSGNRIRVTALLVEASTGFDLWSEKYDRELSDVFVIQDEIARSIVESLQITLSGNQVIPKERPQTQNVEAYQLYLKGMSLFYKRGLHMFDGLKCFEDALKIDPDYVLALVGLADSYTMLCHYSYLPPEDAWPKATVAATRALKISPDLAEGHNALATIALLFEHDWGKAEKEYLKAIDLKPGYIQAQCWYALFYLQNVKHDIEKAMNHVHLAVQYDNLSSYSHTILCAIASNCGLYDVAIEAGEKGVKYDPDSFSAWHILAGSNYCAGHYTEAFSQFKHAIGISGRHNWSIVSLISLLTENTELRNIEEANYLYKELLTRARLSYVSPGILGLASSILDNKDLAKKYIREAIDRHDPHLLLLVALSPVNRAIRKIPEVVEMIGSIGLSFFLPGSSEMETVRQK